MKRKSVFNRNACSDVDNGHPPVSVDNGQQAGVNECKNGGEHSVFRLLLVGIEKHLELLRRQ